MARLGCVCIADLFRPSVQFVPIVSGLLHCRATRFPEVCKTHAGVSGVFRDIEMPQLFPVVTRDMPLAHALRLGRFERIEPSRTRLTIC